jgi:hypothetical protein
MNRRMYGTLVVNSWVSIHDGCDITSHVSGSDDVHFNVEGKGQPFELYFQADALRQFLEAGSQALAAMDAIAAQEEAEWSAQDADSSKQVAGCPA